MLTAQTPFDKVLGISNLKLLRYEWIWEKPQGTGFLNCNKMPLKNHENVLIFYQKKPTYNPQKEKGEPYVRGKNKQSSNYNSFLELTHKNETGDRYPKTVLKFNQERGLHPTQKPVKLFEYLIKTYTNEGEIVLDNCAGSLTTAVACDNLNRKWICMEKEESYCKIGLTRINKNREMLNLPNLNSINSTIVL